MVHFLPHFVHLFCQITGFVAHLGVVRVTMDKIITIYDRISLCLCREMKGITFMSSFGFLLTRTFTQMNRILRRFCVKYRRLRPLVAVRLSPWASKFQDVDLGLLN